MKSAVPFISSSLHTRYSLPHNWSTEAFVYLDLHCTYALLWLVKPAVSFQQRYLPLWIGTPHVFGFQGTYYIIPYLLLSGSVSLQPWVFGFAICCYSVAIFLHFISDAQKYYTLQLRSDLIEDGFFSRTRHPNYLGEALTYISFATLSWHGNHF